MKTITIVSVVDVVGALTTDSLENNIYLLDNNKNGGSSELATETLKTKVNKGDTLLWTIMPMEPESYSAIANIEIDKAVCEPKQLTYEGSDVTYWSATIKKDFIEAPYSIHFKLGNKEHVVKPNKNSRPALIGNK
ncbi:hypothetical protein [Saccharicrinis aurantiacus]|uniref:hypothetical protein n=1 Tax=Saccharicrinis aurantiacus TaxID=1849719 RepID=UPI00094FB52C|nr:hypothetical protein [Saccharicrinis aurantiacus]